MVKRDLKMAIIVAIALIFIISTQWIQNNINKGPLIENIELPENFKIGIFASDLGKSLNLPGPNSGPRFMEFHDDVLFVSLSSAGKVIALPDKDKDGKADEVIEVISGLNRPHGIAFYKDYMYIANEDSVIRVKLNDDFKADIPDKEDFTDLPKGGHWTRTIRVKDGSLYISIGSSCNVCIEKDERRASILKCNLDFGRCNIYARGLRNAVGFAFHPETEELYATENSRDLLGEDTPPDEINIIESNKHYGWPFCYGKNVPDPEFGSGSCEHREQSFIDLQAHSAPLGLAFNFGGNFPSEYKGKLFVAYHGSWNRKVPTGYKIVMIDTETKEVSDFATGWLTDKEKVLGRPVDIIFDKEGVMYVSDDNAGLIYRVSSKG
ncbi:oxidoreductase [Candidatus Woesearchaeota archaeon]|nr:oxidoreductase [Candidatus Woesearchaeota archaeon]|tara:strand:+ start:22227 stop:23363 length:1137 start_codon:yes stop_codon:yes gene_type:complete